jgi:hypothetical protein
LLCLIRNPNGSNKQRLHVHSAQITCLAHRINQFGGSSNSICACSLRRNARGNLRPQVNVPGWKYDVPQIGKKLKNSCRSAKRIFHMKANLLIFSSETGGSLKAAGAD